MPSVIVEQRQQVLAIPPQRAPAQRIAFSRRRIAVLGEQQLTVWDLTSWQRVAQIPVTKPRAVVAMADGAFVVIAGDATWRLEQHETQPARLPRMMLLPGSQLWPDRQAPLTLWVPLAGQLHQYLLPGPDDPVVQRLLPIASHSMPDTDEEACVGLKGGSFLYTAGNELVRFFPGGKSYRGPSPAPSGQVWRLLSARRIDRAWVAQEDGALQLIDFTPNFPVVRSVSLPGKLYDIAANDEHFAIVRTVHDSSSRRTWSVTLLDTAAEPLAEHPLPEGPRPDAPDWVARETRNRGVALAPDGPYLAVGGPSWLTVWHTDTGKAVLSADQARAATADSEEAPAAAPGVPPPQRSATPGQPNR